MGKLWVGSGSLASADDTEPGTAVGHSLLPPGDVGMSERTHRALWGVSPSPTVAEQQLT